MTPDARWRALRRWLRQQMAEAEAACETSRDSHAAHRWYGQWKQVGLTLSEMSRLTRSARRRTRKN